MKHLQRVFAKIIDRFNLDVVTLLYLERSLTISHRRDSQKLLARIVSTLSRLWTCCLRLASLYFVAMGSHATVTSITVYCIGTASRLAVDVEIHFEATIFASISGQSHIDSSVSKLTMDMATTSKNATIGHYGKL